MLNFVKKHWKKIGGIAILIFILSAVGLFILLWQLPPPCCGSNPSEVAGSSVQTQVNKEANPAFKYVKFSNGDSLNAKSIAKNSNIISDGRICVGVSPDMPNRDDFIVSPGSGDVGKDVQYTGNYNQMARLFVYCDNADNILGNVSEDETTLADFEDRYDFSMPDVTNCDFTGSRRRMACVIIVVPDA